MPPPFAAIPGLRKTHRNEQFFRAFRCRLPFVTGSLSIMVSQTLEKNSGTPLRGAGSGDRAKQHGLATGLARQGQKGLSTGTPFSPPRAKRGHE